MSGNEQEFQCRRWALLHDGTAIGCFQNKSSEIHVIIIESHGHCYTYLHPNGMSSRHLTSLALSKHLPFIRASMELRNRYAHYSGRNPYIYGNFARSYGAPLHLKDKRMRALRARWYSGQFNVKCLYDDDTKCFEIRSMEGHATLRLFLHAKLFVATFLVPVTSSRIGSIENIEEQGLQEVAPVSQMFSHDAVPSYFSFPSKVLNIARECFLRNEETFLYLHESDRDILSMLPTNDAFDGKPSWKALDCTKTCEGSLNKISITQFYSTWEPGHIFQNVIVEVREDVVFHVRKNDTMNPMIYIYMILPESLVEYRNGFFHYFDNSSSLRYQFTLDTLPPFAASAEIGIKIAEFCRYAQKLETCAKYKENLRHNTSSPKKERTTLIEEQDIDIGRFRAFSDGKVHVVLADRTILHLDLSQNECSFIFGDGSKKTVGLSSIVSSKEKRQVNVALEFYEWAFSSPEQRMVRHESRSLCLAASRHQLHLIHTQSRLNDSSVIAETLMKNTSPMCFQDNQHPFTQPIIEKLIKETNSHISSVGELLYDENTK